MLKVIPEYHGMFTLKPNDEQSPSPAEDSLCKLMDMNVRIASLYVDGVTKFRRIADEVGAGVLATDEGLKQAQSLDSDLEAAKREFRKPQFSVKAVDRDGVEIDRSDRANFDKAFDIDIHAEDVAISEEKRKFEVEAERTLAVIKKVVDPDIEFSRKNKRTPSTSSTHEIRRKRSRYIQELTGICHVGLEHDDPSQISLAREALAVFRDEFVANEAGPIKNRYLWRLAAPCVLVLALALAAYVAVSEIGFVKDRAPGLYDIRNLALLFVGTGIGTWLSFTLRKPTLSFLDLVALEEDHLDPSVRVIFVSALTFVVGLLLWTDALAVAIGSFHPNGTTMQNNCLSVVLIGVLLGIAERTMTSAVVKRATGFAGVIGGK